MKYYNFKRYKFSTIFKNINFKRYNFSRIYRYFDLKMYNFQKIYRYFDLKRYNFQKIYRYFDLRNYNFSRKIRHFFVKKYIYFLGYGFGFIVISIFIYLSIPLFFNYDKSDTKNILCKDFYVECLVQGKIKYSFFPSPRLKFNNLIIKDFGEKSGNLGKIKEVEIKISPFNLLNKKKFNFTKIEFKNVEINLNLENFDKYLDFYNKKFDLKPISLTNGEVKFFENKKFITALQNVKLKYNSDENKSNTIIKGNFLDDNIYIKLQNKKNDQKPSTFIFFKLLNLKLLTKINIFFPISENQDINGNILFKKDKNRLTGMFDYKEDQLTFKHASLRNSFLDGKLSGEIKFLPYFNFDLDLNLNGLNFNRFYTLINNISEKNKKKLFKIDRKINGKLNLDVNKVYSKYNLIKSFESEIKFTNGNIFVDKMLFNLGKMGAADISGIVKNDGKFSNFVFENNIFFDNQKYFYTKFGIYNKKEISSNLFTSGSLDLENLDIRFNEISGEKKYNEEDIDYVQKEFNELVLVDGYASLFDYLKLKEFVKLLMEEVD